MCYFYELYSLFEVIFSYHADFFRLAKLTRDSINVKSIFLSINNVHAKVMLSIYLN